MVLYIFCQICTRALICLDLSYSWQVLLLTMLANNNFLRNQHILIPVTLIMWCGLIASSVVNKAYNRFQFHPKIVLSKVALLWYKQFRWTDTDSKKKKRTLCKMLAPTNCQVCTHSYCRTTFHTFTSSIQPLSTALTLNLSWGEAGEWGRNCKNDKKKGGKKRARTRTQTHTAEGINTFLWEDQV